MVRPKTSHMFWRSLAFAVLALFILEAYFLPSSEGTGREATPSALDTLFRWVFGAAPARAELHGPFQILLAFAQTAGTVLLSLIPLAMAIILGRRAFHLLHLEVHKNPDDWLYACAFGFGVVSLMTLLLGLTVGLPTWLFRVMAAAVILLGMKDLGDLWGEISGWRTRFATELRDRPFGILFLVTVVVLLGLTACLVPPLDYDVLEYHLGAPAHHYRAGHISFIQYNVYSNFPFNMEMLYLCCIALCRDTLVGSFVGKLVNLQIGVLCAVAIGTFTWRLFGTRAGWCALAIFVICPWFTSSSAVEYDTHALTMYTFLAVYALWQHIDSESRGSGKERWLTRCALMTGLAMGTKYPAFLQVWVPASASVLVFGLLARLRFGRIVRRMGLIVFIPILLVSPWLVKNYVFTGNPIYPLMGSVIEGHEWDAERDARFVQAHRAPGLGIVGLVREIGRRALLSEGSTPLYVVFLLPLLWSRNRSTVIFLGAYVAVYFALWAFFTHRIDRFLVPAVPCLCVLGGAGFAACGAGLGRTIAHVILGVMLTVHTFQAVVTHAVLDGFEVAIGVETASGYLERRAAEANDAIVYMNEKLGDDDCVLFVGEARTFYCNRNYYRGATVFDAQWLDRALGASAGHMAVSEDAALRGAQDLARSGITHIYLNWVEILRLQTTYAFHFDGVKRPGYLHCFHLPDAATRWSDQSSVEAFIEKEFTNGVLRPEVLGQFLRLEQGFGPRTGSHHPLRGVYRLRVPQ